MPTLTHAAIGAAIGMLFFGYSKSQLSQIQNLKEIGVSNSVSSIKQFKTEHFIVFAINCFIGPDWAKFLSPFYGVGYWQSDLFQTLNGFSHTYLGWVLTAIPLSLCYFLLFRFLGEGKKTQKSPITFVHILILAIAGGFNHFGMDLLDSSIRLWPAMWGTTPVLSLETFQTGEILAEGILWDNLAWLDDKYLLIFGILILFGLIYLMKNKNMKWIWGFSILALVLLYGLIILIGSNSVENEHDVGYLVYAVITWIFPVAACIWCQDP